MMPQRSNLDQMESLNTIWIFLPFWLAGTAVLLFLRPKDVRWRLLILQNYVTGLWVAIGTISYSQIFGSVYFSISLSWLIMPVYLHLHLLMPSPIQLKGRWWIPALYVIAGVMALLNMLGVFPLSTYYLSLFIGIGGSLLLLLMRTVRSGLPAERSALNLMLLGIGVSLLPGILLYLVPNIFVQGYTAPPTLTLLSTLAIPTLSFFYIYALYKQRLGDQEVRANRALTSYSFLILYAALFVFAFVLIGQWITLTPNVAILVATVYLVATFAVRPPFERFMNRLVYGTTYDPEHIIQQFANAVPRALTSVHLSDLLTNQVLPRLFIRQSALYWLVENKAQLIYAEQTPEIPSLLEKDYSDRFRSYVGAFLPGNTQPEDRTLSSEFDWVRLVIPIELDNRSVGIWLFGRRDPDDFYPQRDIELLMTLGGQVGIALEFARLIGIERHRADELERLNLQLNQAIRVKEDVVRMTRSFNPYVIGESIRQPENFFGRKRLIQSILDGIHHNNYVIFGERRIGKTSLLMQLSHHLLELNRDEPTYFFVPVYVNLQGIRAEDLFSSLMQRIVQSMSIIRESLNLAWLNESNYDHLSFDEDLGLIVAKLEKQESGKDIRIVLLMDEMDQLFDFEAIVHERLRSCFQTTNGAHLKVVMAGVSVNRLANTRTSPWYNIFSDEIQINPLDENSARQLVEEPVRGYYIFDTEALQLVLLYSDLKPQEIQRLCNYSVRCMQERVIEEIEADEATDEKLTITPEDVYAAVQLTLNAVNEIYQSIWDGFSSLQRDFLREGLIEDGYIDLSSRAGIFKREDMYNISIDLGKDKGHTTKLTKLFQLWLREKQ